MKLSALSAALLLLLSPLLAGEATDPVGQVDAFGGTVTFATADGQPEPVVANQKLTSGQTITVGNSSLVRVQQPGVSVEAHQNSIFSAGENALFQQVGEIDCNIPEQLKAPYELVTPLGTVTSSLARFTTRVDKDGNMQAICHSGSIIINSGANRILVRQNQQAGLSVGPDGSLRLVSLAGSLAIISGPARITLNQGSLIALGQNESGALTLTVVSGRAMLQLPGAEPREVTEADGTIILGQADDTPPSVGEEEDPFGVVREPDGTTTPGGATVPGGLSNSGSGSISRSSILRSALSSVSKLGSTVADDTTEELNAISGP